MKEELLDYLACPDCGNELDLEIFCKEEAEIKDGVFVCKNCHNNYFLIDYIPRFLPVDVIAKSDFLIDFVSKYGERLGQMDVSLNKSKTDFIEDDYQIRLKTIEYFGYEWKKFINWGWLEEEDIPKEERIKYDGGFVSNTISAFKIKSLMTGKDLSSGKLVLDAGCGNGRFSNQAAKYGAEVIGVDIGTGTVEAAYENTRKMDNISIIQGDLFKLPFKKNIFDT
ncbi:MAG: methyltransferase domain-containing protein, partial [Candidatus Omnitrophica bacterium]|nr:methyltransferase domain-containing protein [Candidatus Omnitrophota bacterium]